MCMCMLSMYCQACLAASQYSLMHVFLLHSQICAARDVLVLLGVLTQQGAVGSTPLSTSQLSALQGGVYGQVAVLLQQATLVFWLCSTHATAGRGEWSVRVFLSSLHLRRAPGHCEGSYTPTN